MRKILVTGASGLIGTQLIKLLKSQLLPEDQLLHPTHEECDLLNQNTILQYFKHHHPTHVYHLAAIVGGIAYNNSKRATFIYENTQMQCNVLEGCRIANTQVILFPGSACTYPVNATQPVSESTFYQGIPEETNIAYATAKINGVIACLSYKQQYGIQCVLPFPTNAYGSHDHTNEATSHVIPALFKRMVQAKKNHDENFVIWGTGLAKREFIHSQDVAKAFIFLMHTPKSYGHIINVGTGEEVTILDLAYKIASIVGYKGKISTDTSKPTGVLRKCLNSEKFHHMGGTTSITLDEGLQMYYEDTYK